MRYFIYLERLVGEFTKALYDPMHFGELNATTRRVMFDDLREMIVRSHKQHNLITMYQMTVLIEKLEDAAN